MADLSTTYLGLRLKNPLIVAASGLTASIEGVRKALKAGAGAVVLKSLFEEQLRSDAADVEAYADGAHPEALAYLNDIGIIGGAGEYLQLIRSAAAEAKAEGVPLFASINCVAGERWVDFAEQVEASGASGLELNIAPFPSSAQLESKDVEDSLVAIVRNVSVRTSLPIAVKLGPYCTNPVNLANRLSGAGAKAVILFNRFYRFDFDLDTMGMKAGPMKSGADEYHEGLRWIANLYGAVGCELVGGTGIHSAETALKFIGAGAQTVQVCSALYSGGWATLSAMVQGMEKRMDGLKLSSVDSFRGRLSRRSSQGKDAYERLQYIQALTGIS